MEILEEIYRVIQDRMENPREGSYVCGLVDRGLDAVLAKIEEESGEVLEAARIKDRGELIHEVADLLFHVLVLLGYKGVTPAEIEEELKRRRR
ncbi:MAG: phosphoribosyl-ATP diphosphatase [Methanobacteriota archaeon]|nr:MAG: phosphoribosyl-ATP diphosphatase [Euryarchaeota archaeon]